MENNCDKCLWATRSGGCASWSCEYVNKREAFEAWKTAMSGAHSDEVERRWDESFRASQMPWNHYTEMGS